MYNEQLEKLIEMALVDGELTEKEKQILFKKAESFGVDLDEFEMVLQSKLFEKKQSSNQADSTPVAPKSDKFGDIRKCPACGAMVQSFQAICQDCGHEFTNVNAVGSAQKLFDLLQAATLRNSEKISEHEREKSRRLESLSQKHNSDGTLVKLFAGKSRQEAQEEEREDLIRELDSTRDTVIKSLSQEKGNIIKNFPIPNTKEDLLELLAMATSNAYDNDGRVGYEEEVWIQKTDQIYSKIKIVAEKDNPFLEQATNMIFSLMKRLPSKYKKFTSIPEKMRAKIEAEQQRDAARFNEKRMALIKTYGIWAGGFLLVAIITNALSWFGISLLTTIGFIVTIVKFFRALNKAKNSEI